MADAKRDNNRIPTLLAVSNADGVTPVVLWADPTTHRLLVDLPSAGGTIGGSTGGVTRAIIIANGTGGATVQASGITIDANNNIILPVVTAGTADGIIYKSTSRFIHTFGPSAVNGFNTFVGIGAGNFTMSGGGGAAYSSSYNTGIGASSLASLTGGSNTGYYNTAVGASSAQSLTTGLGNCIIGAWSGYQLTTGNANVLIGPNTGYNSDGTPSSNIYIGSSAGYGVAATTTSSQNVGIGVSSLAGVTTGGATAGNVAVGYFTGKVLTTGTRNTFLGYSAGSTHLTGSYNIILGTDSTGAALQTSGTGVSNEMNIGGALFGDLSTKMFGFGLTNATSATAVLHPSASTTERASLRIPDGVAPTSPNDGDIWSDGTDLFFRNTTSQKIVTDTNTLTISGKTLTAPRIASGGFIADANGNELIIFTTTASAVNEITFANGATGVNPKFTSSGETNVGIDFQSKGSGVYRFLGTASVPAEIRLYEDTDLGTNYSAFKVGTQSADITYTLPAAVAAAGGVLTDAAGNGTLSWAVPSSSSNKIKIATIFETSTRFNLVASGGTSTFDTRGLSLSTTATTTRSIDAQLLTLASGFNPYAGSPIFTCSFGLSPINSTGSAYVGIGAVTVAGTGHTFTDSHIGFKVLISGGVASLYATQAGGSETASSALTTLADTDMVDVIAVVNGTSSVDYYWRKNGGALSSATNLSTNIPSAATDKVLDFSISNNSTAVTQTMWLTSASYER